MKRPLHCSLNILAKIAVAAAKNMKGAFFGFHQLQSDLYASDFGIGFHSSVWFVCYQGVYTRARTRCQASGFGFS